MIEGEKRKREVWATVKLKDILKPHGRVKHSGRTARLGDETFKIGGGTVESANTNILREDNTERAIKEICPTCPMYERGECDPGIEICPAIMERAVELLLEEDNDD